MNNLLKNWDVARIIRLLAGIGLGIYAVVSKDYVFLLLAGVFLLQAVLNLSCCGMRGCSAGEVTSQKRVYKNEIKTYNPNQK